MSYTVSFWGVAQLRGSSTGFSRFSPTKVEAHKSFLFTESFLVLKIKNTLLMIIKYIKTALFKKNNGHKIGKFQLFKVFPKVYVLRGIWASIKVNLAMFLGFLAFCSVSSFGVKLTNVPSALFSLRGGYFWKPSTANTGHLLLILIFQAPSHNQLQVEK